MINIKRPATVINERDLRDPKMEATLMIVKLFEYTHMSREEVYQILQDRFYDDGDEMLKLKCKIFECPPKLTSWQKFIRFLYLKVLVRRPPEVESINQVMLNALEKDLKITRLAIERLEQEAGQDILRRSRRPRRSSD